MLDRLWPRRCAACEAYSAQILCARCGPVGLYRGAPLDGLVWHFALAPYASPVGRLVRRAKAGGERGVARYLATHLAEVAGQLPGRFDAVVPVPTPLPRRLRRGFCLPSMLAVACGRSLGSPVVQALGRGAVGRRAGRAGRSADEVHGFTLRRRPPENVLLVDDVCTTGATLERCAGLLRSEAGGHVSALTLCVVEKGERAGGPTRE